MTENGFACAPVVTWEIRLDVMQGCALRAPGCLRRLTFAFGRPGNLISFI